MHDYFLQKGYFLSPNIVAYINQLALIARFQVPQDRRLIQVGQVGHVLALLKLGRIDLPNQLRLEGLFLKFVNAMHITI